MVSDKVAKEEFKKRIPHEYAKFFPVAKLSELGFSRRICSSCQRSFWSVDERKVCGEPACEGGYSFIGKQRDDWDFIEVWKRFDKLFREQGYTSIARYPSVARWNPTMDFTIASVADFQPYVVSGEVEPPAEKVVVPQTCIRFNDLDNVGITGRHYTGFTMIGQLAFQPKGRFEQPRLFEDYYNWYAKGMRMRPGEFVIHEDAWAGGGNFGPCLEFFSGGLEIGNQVYMMYENTDSGPRELKLKVLDMGMGQERPAWFMSGSPTSYEVSFPTVTSHLFKRTGISPDKRVLAAFIPYSGLLNVDEADVDLGWEGIGRRTGYAVSALKEQVLPSAALYAIGDHARTLLYTIADGALPGNVGGGYNLRVIYRRILSFLEKYGWDIDLDKVIELHAAYLKPQYPEFKESVDLVKTILAVERKKADANKQRSTQVISQMFDKGAFSKGSAEVARELTGLYDSQGILPEDVRAEGERRGMTIAVPDNFFAMVAERHEADEEKARHATKTRREDVLDVDGIPETTALYFDRWDLVEFDAYVIKAAGRDIILDETAFYPTSGGQVHDTGTIAGIPVVEVFKQGNVIIHVLEETPKKLKKGDRVHGRIDLDRRMQLCQHHTGAHILNGAAKKVLGRHVWQAGAAKTPEKARLDITHYESLTEGEIRRIEDLANAVIRENRPVTSVFMERNLAEREFGFAIYQGGAVPGKRLRIVNIKDFDVEACGGTHFRVTGDVYRIVVTKTSKVQDGVIRIEFVAGAAAAKHAKTAGSIAQEVAALLSCEEREIPGRCLELFSKWKQATKLRKRGEPVPEETFLLFSHESSSGDALEEAARILNTQKEHLAKTITRFKADLEKVR